MIEFDVHLNQGNFGLHASMKSDAKVIGLFGPSGAGKSTLLNILSGSIAPARGTIVINGRCLLDTAKNLNVPVHQRRIGVVYQDGKLFPHLSVKNNLTYGMHLLNESQRRFKFDHIVSLLEIGHLLQNRPNLLSGGERQRVALGRALLSSPQILLMDEPVASLDDRLKAQIIPFLRRVKEETSIPMIYVSHAIREILELTQHLAVIQDGSILAYGNYHDVLTSNAVLPLAQSLGIENVLSVTLIEHHAESGYSIGTCGRHKMILPICEAPINAEIHIIVPASNVSLATATVQGTTIQNQIMGTVESIRNVGHRALVSIDIGTMLLAEISEKSIGDLKITEGQKICCLIKAQSIRLLSKAGAAKIPPQLYSKR